MPTADSIIIYFNIGIIIFLFLGALLGLKKGFFKSTYNLVVFLGLLIIGLIISPLFTKMILNFDISKIVQFDVEGVAITSMESSIAQVAGVLVPALEGKVVPGTEMYELVYQFISMIARLMFVIIWFFLTVTLFKLISWIVYLIIRPGKKTKKKKTMNSRFMGMGVGFIHALVVIFIMSIPLAGLISIASSAEALIESDPSEETISYEGEESSFIEIAEGQEDEAFDVVFEVMSKYRSTVMGGISGLIKIDNEGLDERAFSSMFAIKYNKKKIRLTSEIKKGLSIYSLIEEKIDGEITLNKIMALDDETIDYIATSLKNLKIINVIPPIGLEFAYLTGELDMLTEEDYSVILSDVKGVNFSNDISLLFNSGIKAGKLGIFEEQETDFYLNLDVAKVKEIFSEIGSMELLNAIDEFAFEFIVKLDEFREVLIGADIDPDEIDFVGVSLGDEIANLGNLYEAFREMKVAYNTTTQAINLDLVTDDSINLFSTAVYNSDLFSKNVKVLTNFLINQLPEEYKNILTIEIIEQNDFVSILTLGVILIKANILSDDFYFTDLFTEEIIEKIAIQISSSHLLADNINGVLDIILTEANLPFAIEIPDSFTWYGETGKTELKSLLGSAGQLFELGIAENTFIDNLNSENINELADIMGDSVILMYNMNNLLNFAIDESGISDTVTIIIREIDWTSTEGKAEFKNILGSVALIFEAKLLDNPNFATLSDGTVDTNMDGIINEQDDNIIKDLANKLSSSIIIKDNLSNIINQVVSTQIPELELETFSDPNEWTERELDSIFRATKIIITKENIPEDLFVLPENEIDTILTSKLISQIFVKTIEKEAAIGGSLHGVLIIDRADGLWYDTYTGEIRVDGELRKLIKSAQLLLGDMPNFDDPSNIININGILNLADEDLTELTSSIVLRDSISQQLIDLGTDKFVGGVLTEAVIVVDIPQFDPNWETEIPKFIKAIKVIVGETVDLDNLSVDVNSIINLTDGTINPEDDEIKEMLASKIISDTIIEKIVELGDTGGSLVVNLLENDPRWYDTSTEDGEVRKLIKTLKLLLGGSGDITNPSAIDIDEIINLDETGLNTLVTSIIIVDTAVKSLEDLTTPTGSLHNILIIPSDLESDDYYGVEGELKKFLIAVKAIKGSDPLANTTFNVDKFLGADQETLLDSRIIEASAISYIKDSPKLLIPDNQSPYYYLSNESIVWERTYTGETLEDVGELRRFFTSVKLLVGGDTFASLSFNMNTMLSVDFTEIIKSRVLEATIADMVNDLISGTLTGLIKEPTNNYQWYYHETSDDITVGSIRRGEFELTITPTYQYSDLLGFLNSIQEMDSVGLNFNAIDMHTIAATDSTDLATALWDYSRITRGSIATILNYVLKDVSNPFKPVFVDAQFSQKQEVINGLDLFKVFVNTP